ncbi:uncharacterized protein LOC132718492 isoform X2 [Ruditapes philippinarum]|uniref:uncharacterized protein LOC132718492 isoform X2 n=1 Tax=Ruditapes philippinarum TaxID=129788 RepID=UPI00295B9F97|nr:uncharacterized protein LOC132718492 isoform X2 [Ruditapes philippinarum]
MDKKFLLTASMLVFVAIICLPTGKAAQNGQPLNESAVYITKEEAAPNGQQIVESPVYITKGDTVEPSYAPPVYITKDVTDSPKTDPARNTTDKTSGHQDGSASCTDKKKKLVPLLFRLVRHR